MNIINQAMFYLLDVLHNLTGSYGLAIILLTVGIRLILWPLNSEQTRSMRKMQALQPKLKALQEKHKDNPQKMQEQMMKFYAENKFNPLAGCLPLLVQLPIFIGLFGALNSPTFLTQTVHEDFLFINKLYHTMQSHAGEPLDGTFAVEEKDDFATDNTATLVFKTGKTKEQNISNTTKVLRVSPQPLLPGEPARMQLNLAEMGLGDEYADLLKSATVLVSNQKSKELERVAFTNHNGRLVASVPTVQGKNKLNIDVLVLVVIYGLLTVLYQKVMSPPKPAATASSPEDPQAQVMKLMPLMFVGLMFFIPMPAGVLLYLVVTTALMFIQTAWVNYTESKREGGGKPADQVVDIKPE